MTRFPPLILAALLPSLAFAGDDRAPKPAEAPAVAPVAVVPAAAPALPPVADVPPVAPPAAEAVPPVRFAAADEDEFSGRALDAFSFAGRTTMSGTVDDAFFALSGDVDLPGTVHGDAYLGGGDVDVLGHVAGDLYAMSGSVNLLPGSRVDGSVFAFAGDVELRGAIGRDLHVGAGRLVLAGPIGGAVQAEVGELVVEPAARVGGNLRYEATKEAAIPSGAVGGETSYTKPDDDGHELAAAVDEAEGGIGFGFRVFALLSGLVLGGVLLGVGGSFARRAIGAAGARPALQLGLGFALAVSVPAVALVACLFVLPIPLSVAALLLLSAMALFGRVVSAVALGEFVLARAGRGGASPYLGLLVGLVIVTLLAWIPVVGFFVSVAATLAGIGALFTAARGQQG